MNRVFASVLFVCLGAAQAAVAAELPAESCDQIRAQIKAHTGLPSKPNTTLLGKVGANEQCRFTSTEAYRAAWGDKPMPKEARGGNKSNRRNHSDD